MNAKASRILNIVTKIITWLLVIFTVFMMVFTIFTVTTVDKTDRNFFGYKFYIVTSDSMSKSEKNADMEVHFNAGDIIIAVEPEDAYSLLPGDIITFVSSNSDSYGQTITHMIRAVTKNGKGEVIGYTTYGTNKGVNDEAMVDPFYVLGVYKGKIQNIGSFFAFVKSTPGYIVCILIPFLLLILYNGINVIILFRRYKREQMEALQAEKDKIEEERDELRRMRQEILELKAQLSKQDDSDTKKDVSDNGNEPKQV